MSEIKAGRGWSENGWRPMVALIGYKWATCVYFQDGGKIATRRQLSSTLTFGRVYDPKGMAKRFLKAKAHTTKGAKEILLRAAA